MSWTALQTLSDAELIKMSANYIEIYNQIEKDSIQLVLAPRFGKQIFACFKKGWVFISRAGSGCENKALLADCDAGSLRCAKWSGGSCVRYPNDALHSDCLLHSKTNPVDAMKSFYPSHMVLSWNIRWLAIHRYCNKHSARNPTCSEILKVAKRKHDGKKIFLKLETEFNYFSRQNWPAKSPHMFWLLGGLLTTAHAEPTCRIDQTTQTFFRGPGNSVNMIFGTHLSPGAMDNFLGGVLEQNISPDEVQRKTDEFVQQNSDTLEHYKKANDQISALVNRHGRNAWVAVESSPEELTDSVISQIQADVAVYRQYLTLNGVAPNRVEDVILLAYGPGLYLKHLRPQQRLAFQLFGAEANGLREQSLEENRRMIRMIFEDMKALLETEKIDITFVRAALRVRSNCLNENRIPTAAERSEVAAMFSEPEVKRVVNQYFDHVKTFIELSSRRDNAVATRLSTQNGNGILIMGAKHSAGVQAGLIRTCQNPPPSQRRLQRHGTR